MGAMASQITSLTVVYSTIYSGADQRKHQSPASLAFVRGIHRWSVNSPHKGPVTRKMFPFDDIIMKLGPSLIHVMAHCLFGTKPSPQPIIWQIACWPMKNGIHWHQIQRTTDFFHENACKNGFENCCPFWIALNVLYLIKWSLNQHWVGLLLITGSIVGKSASECSKELVDTGWRKDIKMEIYIDALVQECSNCIANALELFQSCTKPSI